MNIENYTSLSEGGDECLLSYEENLSEERKESEAEGSAYFFGTNDLLTQCLPEWDENIAEEYLGGNSQNQSDIDYNQNEETNTSQLLVNKSSKASDGLEEERESNCISEFQNGIDTSTVIMSNENSSVIEVDGLNKEEESAAKPPVPQIRNEVSNQGGEQSDGEILLKGCDTKPFQIDTPATKPIENICFSVYNGETQSLPSQFPLSLTQVEKKKICGESKNDNANNESSFRVNLVGKDASLVINKVDSNAADFSNDDSYYNASTEPLSITNHSAIISNELNDLNKSPNPRSIHIIQIQTVCRKWLSRRSVHQKAAKATSHIPLLILLQSVVRGFLIRRKLSSTTKSPHGSRQLQEMNTLDTARSLVLIQAACRRWLSRRRVEVKASKLSSIQLSRVTLLQAVCRRFLTSRKITLDGNSSPAGQVKDVSTSHTKRSITLIQAICRRWLCRKLAHQKDRTSYSNVTHLRPITQFQAVCRGFLTRKKHRQQLRDDEHLTFERASVGETQTLILGSDNTNTPNLGILSYTPTANNDSLSYPRDYLDGKNVPIVEHKDEVNKSSENSSTEKRYREDKVTVPFSVTPLSQNLLEPQIKPKCDFRNITEGCSVSDEIMDGEENIIVNKQINEQIVGSSILVKENTPTHKLENDHSSRGSWLHSKRFQPSKRCKISKDIEKELCEDAYEESPQLCPPRLKCLSLPRSNAADSTPQKHDAIYDSKIVEEKDNFDLNDTQPSDDIDLSRKVKLSRLTKGTRSNVNRKEAPKTLKSACKKSSKSSKQALDPGTSGNEYSDEENEFVDTGIVGYEYIEQSQSTIDIRSKLRTLEKINVSNVTENLRQIPGVEMRNMKQEMEELKQKVEALCDENEGIKKENKALHSKLAVVNKKLQDKTALCDEMRIQLYRLEPIINAAIKVGNNDQALNGTERVKNLHSNNASKRFILESDTDEDDEIEDVVPQNDDVFRTPEKKRERDLHVISTGGTTRGEKKNFTGKVTFNELWKFLQDRGWKFRTGPEPFGKVYVPPDGNVRKGSVLGKHFFVANDLWGIAAEAGFVDCDDDGVTSKEQVKGCNTNNSLENCQDNTTHFVENPLHEIPSPPDIKNQKVSTKETKPFSESKHHQTVPTNDCKTDLTRKPSAKKIAKVMDEDKNTDDDVSDEKDKNTDDDISYDKLDNTKLCGTYKILTRRSITKCSHFILKFLSKGSNAQLMRDLFVQLWKCIKDEHGSEVENLGWTYVKSRGAGNLGRRDWFAPPNSKGAGGLFGKDYFTTEEAVVAHVFQELKELDSNITGFTRNQELFDTFGIKLSRAMEDHISFDEVSITSPSDGSRRSRKRSRSKRDTPQFQMIERPKKIIKPIGDSSKFFEYSQNAMNGANILLEMNKIKTTNELATCSVPTKRKRYDNIATLTGIQALLRFRSDLRRLQSKRPTSNLSLNKDTMAKNIVIKEAARGRSKGLSTSEYHLTQGPRCKHENHATLSKSVAKGIRRPLDGLQFFTSGIDEVANLISQLGGQLLNDIEKVDLKERNITRKLFFVSDPKFRRTHKYVLAGALGVPMLHFNWLFDLKKSFTKYKKYCEDGKEEVERPDAFNSRRYTSFRLPVGLSIETGLFVMQRARHAKKWSRPCCGSSSSLVFDGMRIAMALDKPEIEKKWTEIITALGATIACLPNDEKFYKSNVDMVLVDSVCLPPHVTAVPARTTKTLNSIKRWNEKQAESGNTVPIVDLSWVSQCIVRRTRIPVDSDGRYCPQVGNFGTLTVQSRIVLYSIKVQTPTGLVRYEVGDSIYFGKNKAKPSTGRIRSIHHDTRERKNVIKVKVLELHNRFEIMDGGKNMSSIELTDSELQGHIILLGGNDFNDVFDGWARGSGTVFLQKKV